MNTRCNDIPVKGSVEYRAQKIVEEVMRLKNEAKYQKEMKKISIQCTHEPSKCPESKTPKVETKVKKKIEIRRASSRIASVPSIAEDIPMRLEGEKEPSLLDIMTKGKEIMIENISTESENRNKKASKVPSKNKSKSDSLKGIPIKKTEEVILKPSKEDFEAIRKDSEYILKSLKKEDKYKMILDNFLSEESDDSDKKLSTGRGVDPNFDSLQTRLEMLKKPIWARSPSKLPHTKFPQKNSLPLKS